jgi:hypothetical protein
MKQTAVEWLACKFDTTDIEEFKDNFNDLIKQAKEMEKEQIIQASENGKEDVFDWLKKMDYDFLVEEIIKSE